MSNFKSGELKFKEGILFFLWNCNKEIIFFVSNIEFDYFLKKLVFVQKIHLQGDTSGLMVIIRENGA